MLRCRRVARCRLGTAKSSPRGRGYPPPGSRRASLAEPEERGPEQMQKQMQKQGQKQGQKRGRSSSSGPTCRAGSAAGGAAPSGHGARRGATTKMTKGRGLRSSASCGRKARPGLRGGGEDVNGGGKEKRVSEGERARAKAERARRPVAVVRCHCSSGCGKLLLQQKLPLLVAPPAAAAAGRRKMEEVEKRAKTTLSLPRRRSASMPVVVKENKITNSTFSPAETDPRRGASARAVPSRRG